MKNSLRIIIVVIGLVVILCVASLLLPAEENYFSIDLGFNADSYVDNDEVIVNAKLKNSSFGLYKGTFTAFPLIIQVYEKDQDSPAVISIATENIILPFGTFKNTYKFNLDIDKDYVVRGVSLIKIKNENFIIERLYLIEAGIVKPVAY